MNLAEAVSQGLIPAAVEDPVVGSGEIRSVLMHEGATINAANRDDDVRYMAKLIAERKRRARGIKPIRTMGFMVTPMIYLIAGVALVAALGAVAYGLDKRGYNRGTTEVEAKYAKRDNEALRAANARIQALQETARSKEAESALRLTAVSARYQKELSDANVRNALLDADVRTGRLKLRDPGATGAAVCAGGTGPEVAAGTGGRDGAAGTELPGSPAGVLSRDATEFLIALTGEADEIVLQLGACQAVIEADRK